MRKTTRFLIVAFLLAAACATAPPAIPLNRHGLPVVTDARVYRALAAGDPDHVLVSLPSAVPGIVLDIRYATTANFMNEQLYPRAVAFLRCEPARALAAAQRDLVARGLGLKVFDAYRPYSVTERMWERWKDPDFVADPARGSRHNRGAAVDVTLVDLASGRELPMPTPYDDFTPAASATYPEVSEQVRRNRETLIRTMESRGFVVLPSEWWHFDFVGWETYALLDLPHAALEPPSAACPPLR